MSVVDALPPRLADVLAERPDPTGTSGPAAVVRYLSDRPALLRRWLHELRTTALLDIAKASAWHHNGFAKVVLHQAEHPGLRIRLHVWPPAHGGSSGRRGDSDAHNHRWPFASTVVVGAGLDTTHFLETSGAGHVYERHLVGPEVAGLRPMGRTRLVRVDGFVRARQDIYECPTSTVHTIEPRGPGAVATLVVTRAAAERTSSIFRRPGDLSDPGTRPLTADELWEMLGEVGKAL